MLIIDETSMVDFFLFDHVVDAVPLSARLVLIGDVDQLPSVGPGQVLADVIASGIAPTVRFTQLYRRSTESTITESAHQVRDGHIPQLINDRQRDFRFIEEAVSEELLCSACLRSKIRKMECQLDDLALTISGLRGTITRLKK